MKEKNLNQVQREVTYAVLGAAPSDLRKDLKKELLKADNQSMLAAGLLGLLLIHRPANYEDLSCRIRSSFDVQEIDLRALEHATISAVRRRFD